MNEKPLPDHLPENTQDREKVIQLFFQCKEVIEKDILEFSLTTIEAVGLRKIVEDVLKRGDQDSKGLSRLANWQEVIARFFDHFYDIDPQAAKTLFDDPKEFKEYIRRKQAELHHE